MIKDADTRDFSIQSPLSIKPLSNNHYLLCFSHRKARERRLFVNLEHFPWIGGIYLRLWLLFQVFYLFVIDLAPVTHPVLCRETHFGCCPDGETAAHGPNSVGCPGKFLLHQREVRPRFWILYVLWNCNTRWQEFERRNFIKGCLKN